MRGVRTQENNMAEHGKDINPITTFWQESDNGLTLIETIPGLPYGTPGMGQTVATRQYGEALCSGVTKSGSGANEGITEIKLTVK